MLSLRKIGLQDNILGLRQDRKGWMQYLWHITSIICSYYLLKCIFSESVNRLEKIKEEAENISSVMFHHTSLGHIS